MRGLQAEVCRQGLQQRLGIAAGIGFQGWGITRDFRGGALLGVSGVGHY